MRTITIRDSVINLSSVKALEMLGYKVKLIITRDKPAFDVLARPSHNWIKLRKGTYVAKGEKTYA